MRKTSRPLLSATATIGATLTVLAVTVGYAGAAPPSASPPVNRSLPSIAGRALEGEVVRARPGDWGGTRPLTFAYQWRRCGRFGGNCVNVVGATGRAYTVTAADVGRTLRVLVSVTNADGSGAALSRPTAVVRRTGVAPPQPPPAPAGPAGQVRLPDGTISIPVTSVRPPERLIISRVAFSPNPVRSRTPFTGRFRVTDTRGYVVRGAVVFALGVPYGRIHVEPEQVTGTDGYVTFTFRPTAGLPLRRGAYLVVFLRARKQGDNLLAGVSTRRLVQVRLGPPS